MKKWVLLVIACVLLSSCGTKGRLYLPGENNKKSNDSSQKSG